jgi:cobalt-zinc-cadmium resistance protein CzcA
MIENIHRHLSRRDRGDDAGDGAECGTGDGAGTGNGITDHEDGDVAETSVTERRNATILRAVAEVDRPILFSVVIIIVVFLPLLTLRSVEGKMFAPMAITIVYALLGSLAAALVMAPVLASFLHRTERRDGHGEPRLLRGLKRLYRPLLERCIRRRGVVLAIAVLALAGTLLLVPRLGTEFIPVLEEGNIQVLMTFPPSTSLDKVTASVQRIEREVAAYPEVAQAITRIGRPEAGSHPHPVNFASMQIELVPDVGRGGLRGKQELIVALDHDIRRHPGVQLNFTQPIQNLFDELLSGARTQLAIKLYGEDLEVLEEQAASIEAAVRGIDGLVDLGTEQSFGQPQLQVVPDREACARHGVDVNDIMEMVELAIGGEEVSSLYRGNRRFGIHVRYLADFRERPEVIRDLLVKTASGARLPLSELATIREVVGPVQINREHNQRRWVVSANVRGRDIGSVVADIQRAVEERVSLPPGYFIEYGGQFESQQRAMRRLAIIVPAALGLILLLLYLALGSIRLAALIYANIPLALIGGVAGLLVMGEYLSVPASVGFIALFGIAVQNGLVLVTYFVQLERQGLPVRRAVLEGAELRLRPVLMTALTTIAGLTPLLLASGIGSEVQRPLATVVVFGLASSTGLTLILLPALYDWLASRKSVSTRSGS